MGKPQVERPTGRKARAWFPGTFGDDVMTVRWMRTEPDETRCGAAVPQDAGTKEVYRWQRAVSCPDCLSAAD